MYYTCCVLYILYIIYKIIYIKKNNEYNSIFLL